MTRDVRGERIEGFARRALDTGNPRLAMLGVAALVQLATRHERIADELRTAEAARFPHRALDLALDAASTAA